MRGRQIVGRMRAKRLRERELERQRGGGRRGHHTRGKHARGKEKSVRGRARKGPDDEGRRGRSGNPGGGASMLPPPVPSMYTYIHMWNFIRESPYIYIYTGVYVCVKGVWLPLTRARSLFSRPHGALSDVYKRTLVHVALLKRTRTKRKRGDRKYVFVLFSAETLFASHR